MPQGTPAWREPTHVAVTRVIQEIHERIDARTIDRDKLHDLTDQIETITKAALEPIPPEEHWKPFHLTPTEARVAGLLYSKLSHTVSTTALLNALYFDRPANEWPGDKMIAVSVCKLRKKLTQHNAPLAIDTVWGLGFKMEKRDALVRCGTPVRSDGLSEPTLPEEPARALRALVG